MSGQKLSLEALMSASGPGLFVTPAAAPAASKGPVAGQSAAPSQASSSSLDRDAGMAAAGIAGSSNQQGHQRQWDRRHQGQPRPQEDHKAKKKKRSKNKNRGAGGGSGAVGGQGSPGDLQQAYQAIFGEGSGSGTTGPKDSNHQPSPAPPQDRQHRGSHNHNKKRKQKSIQTADGEGTEQTPYNKRRKNHRPSQHKDPNRDSLSKTEKLALTFYNRDDGQQRARNLDERPELVGLGTRAGGDDDFDALLTDHMQKTTQEIQQQMEAEAKRLKEIQKEQERLIKETEAKMKQEAEKLAAAAATQSAGPVPVAAAEGVAATAGSSSLPSSTLSTPGSNTQTEAAGAVATKPQRKFIPRILCIYWARGRCTNENCTFKHDPSIPQRPPTPPPPPIICKYAKTGSCVKGDACQFSHDLKSIPCYHYFLRGYCQHSSEACLYNHENATEAQLQELKEEWNQKRMQKAAQFQPPRSELDAVIASVPPGSFGTGSAEATGVSYGTSTTTTQEVPFHMNQAVEPTNPSLLQQAHPQPFSSPTGSNEPSL